MIRTNSSSRNLLATVAVVVGTAILGWSASVSAATYRVGPNHPYSTLQAVLNLLKPGDIVEVDGDTTYPGDIHFSKPGKPDARITIRGIPVNGKPPVLSGGDEFTVLMNGNHYVLETFDITGGKQNCVIHKANDVILRDIVVHDCPNNGIVSTDDNSGSLTVSHAEVFRCGSGEKRHQLYIATDQIAYPGSTFRLQFSYVHDGNGGNNVKTRAERNEIYYNWIEGAVFHTLDMIGPVRTHPPEVREHSDVVGNVIITTSSWQIARFGGDGDSATAARYRFVNNTFVMGTDARVALRMQQSVESVELHNNVFFKQGDKDVELIRFSDPDNGAPDPVIRGANNWIQTGFSDVPPGLSGSIKGSSPGFASLASFDLTPSETSPLVGAGTTATALNDGHAMPKPLVLPEFVPPSRMRLSVGQQVARPTSGAIDIGAFVYGLPAAPPAVWGVPDDVDDPIVDDPPLDDPVDGSVPDVSAPDGSSQDGQSRNDAGIYDSGDTRDAEGCACGVALHANKGELGLLVMLGLVAGSRFRTGPRKTIRTISTFIGWRAP